MRESMNMAVWICHVYLVFILQSGHERLLGARHCPRKWLAGTPNLQQKPPATVFKLDRIVLLIWGGLILTSTVWLC
jgi:hypothetical protein